MIKVAENPFGMTMAEAREAAEIVQTSCEMTASGLKQLIRDKYPEVIFDFAGSDVSGAVVRIRVGTQNATDEVQASIQKMCKEMEAITAYPEVRFKFTRL